MVAVAAGVEAAVVVVKPALVEARKNRRPADAAAAVALW